jgi:hypothetical protein
MMLICSFAVLYKFLNIININKMKKNIGTIDKVIRILVAVVVAVLYYAKIFSGTTGIIMMALSVIFVVTSLISYCPLYQLISINTRKKV